MVRKRSIRQESFGRTLLASHWVREMHEYHRFGANMNLGKTDNYPDDSWMTNGDPNDTEHVHYYKIRTIFGLVIRIRFIATDKKYTAEIMFSTQQLQTPRAWEEKMKRIGIDKQSWYHELASNRSPYFIPRGGQAAPHLEFESYQKIANMWKLPFPMIEHGVKIDSYEKWVKSIGRKNGYGKHKAFSIRKSIKTDEIESWEEFLKKTSFGDSVMAMCHRLSMRPPTAQSDSEPCSTRYGIGGKGRNTQGIIEWAEPKIIDYAVALKRSNLYRWDFFHPGDSDTFAKR